MTFFCLLLFIFWLLYLLELVSSSEEEKEDEEEDVDFETEILKKDEIITEQKEKLSLSRFTYDHCNHS